ncbi:hypothetical protein CDAR_552211 [Caerostris darwini]|uniref:Uncharacterized protein n=1 Tax=Caerostris darwini TaxID=1538125 RepID=A0AAV4NLM3_9ARAC|nr:hypothetical protein CDAR_552211 [Caerostris darwini]
MHSPCLSIKYIFHLLPPNNFEQLRPPGFVLAAKPLMPSARRQFVLSLSGGLFRTIRQRKNRCQNSNGRHSASLLPPHPSLYSFLFPSASPPFQEKENLFFTTVFRSGNA